MRIILKRKVFSEEKENRISTTGAIAAAGGLASIGALAVRGWNKKTVNDFLKKSGGSAYQAELRARTAGKVAGGLALGTGVLVGAKMLYDKKKKNKKNEDQ